LFIFRFENEKGDGIFTTVYDKGSLENKILKYHKLSQYEYHPDFISNMPNPREDKIVNFTSDYYFGFLDWKQLNKVFKPYMRKLLQKAVRENIKNEKKYYSPMRLCIYKVAKKHVLKGNHQVAFLKGKAKMIERFPVNVRKNKIKDYI